jgi:hypothetical protein
MSESETPAWQEHGYWEVYVPVWNPNEGKDENTIRNLTLDIVADEERLNGISQNLSSELAKYTQSEGEEMSGIERYVAQNLRSMLRAGLIWDADCGDHGVSDVASLQSRLNDEDFEVFPL